LTEASFADAAHNQKMFDAAKRAVTLAMLDDAGCERRPYAGQTLQFLARRMID